MTDPTPLRGTALSLVMPAHNEFAGIESAVVDAVAVLRSLAGDDVECIIVDDASTDGTGAVLDRLAADEPVVRVVHLTQNVGHGPALRTGWDLACGEWVAHLDSDDEIPADQLGLLWTQREGADLVLGVRTGRESTPSRRFVTATLRAVAHASARRRLADANSPCKIVHGSALRRALGSIPGDAFAPSVLLAVRVARTGGVIREVPVATRPRAHGRSWLVPTRLAKGAIRSFRDTVSAGVKR